MYEIRNPMDRALEGLDQAASTYASMDQNIPAQQDPGPTIGGALQSGMSGARFGYTALDMLGTVPATVPASGTSIAGITAAGTGQVGGYAAGTAAAGTAAAGTTAAGTAAAGTAASGASAAAPTLLGMGPAGWLIGGAVLGIGAYLLS